MRLTLEVSERIVQKISNVLNTRRAYLASLQDELKDLEIAIEQIDSQHLAQLPESEVAWNQNDFIAKRKR